MDITNEQETKLVAEVERIMYAGLIEKNPEQREHYSWGVEGFMQALIGFGLDYDTRCRIRNAARKQAEARSKVWHEEAIAAGRDKLWQV